jgi:hypothetical protein
MSEMSDIASGIIEEAERLANENFRKYLQQMEEVFRFDCGGEKDADMYIAVLQKLSKQGHVQLVGQRLLRLSFWLQSFNGKNGEEN